jgi:superfamily II DNA or RNA helicase
MIRLREDQIAARDAVIRAIKSGNGVTIGRVVIPTGGGKTFIEAAVIDYQREKNSNTRIHLVLAPRILLTNQLISEFRKFSGNAYRAIAFHSGTHEPDSEQNQAKPDSEKIKWNEEATTDIKVLNKHFQNAKKANQDLIVFSTYHSAHKLSKLKFDTMIADESQYCVSENFNDVVKTINSRVKLFFTATEKHTVSAKGFGLNNEEVFGPRLYYISPDVLIKKGIIVPPRLHVMYVEAADDEKSKINEILEIARVHDAEIRPRLGFSKTLFAMKGTKDVATVEKNIEKIKTEFPNHKIFTILSKTGARIDGNQVNRELEFLPALKSSENCLIFHYDILSEGIDIDGITGVALMRNMGLAKLLQTIGRAVRVYKANPAAKKWALISVSVINNQEDTKENVKYYVNALRNGGYDISKEDVIVSEPRHEKDDTDIPDAYKKVKKRKYDAVLWDVFHEIENEDIFDQMRMIKTNEDKIKFLFNL